MMMFVVDMFVYGVDPEVDSDADGVGNVVAVVVVAEATVDIPGLEEMMAFLLSTLWVEPESVLIFAYLLAALLVEAFVFEPAALSPSRSTLE